jgi:hypothetical protein
VVLPVRLPGRRRGGPQPGDDPAQHAWLEEHGQPPSGGAQLRRPDEVFPATNRRRKTYSALYTYHQFLDYYREQRAQIAGAIEQSVAFQRRNRGRIVFRGSYDVPAFPAPHPGEAPPPEEPPEGILDPPPCGYLLTDAQYTGPQPDGRPVADRLAAHGIKVQRRGPGRWFVRMRQDLRGLVPLLLDGEAAEPMVAGQRVAC